MLRATTLLTSLVLLGGTAVGQLDGTFHEVKLSVGSLDITRGETKSDPDLLASSKFKSAKQGLYLELREEGDDEYDITLWILEGETWAEYDDVGSLGAPITDAKGKNEYRELEFDVRLPVPTFLGGPVEGFTVDGIVRVKAKYKPDPENPAANEVQTLTGGFSNGDYNLEFGGETTADINANATAAQVQAALEALSTIGAGNVAVTDGAPTSYVITFQGDLAETDVEEIDVSDDTTDDGDVDVNTTTPGSDGLGLSGLAMKLEKAGASTRELNDDGVGTPRFSSRLVDVEDLPDGVGDEL